MSPNHALWQHRSPLSSLEPPSAPHFGNTHSSPYHSLFKAPEALDHKHTNCVRTRSLPHDHSPTTSMKAKSNHFDTSRCELNSMCIEDANEDNIVYNEQSFNIRSSTPLVGKHESCHHSMSVDATASCDREVSDRQSHDHNINVKLFRHHSIPRNPQKLMNLIESEICENFNKNCCNVPQGCPPSRKECLFEQSENSHEHRVNSLTDLNIGEPERSKMITLSSQDENISQSNGEHFFSTDGAHALSTDGEHALSTDGEHVLSTDDNIGSQEEDSYQLVVPFSSDECKSPINLHTFSALNLANDLNINRRDTL